MARLILVWMLLGGSVLPAQSLLLDAPESRELVRSTMTAIYELDTQKAHTGFKQLHEDFPNHPGPWIIQSMSAWWKIVLNEKFSGFDSEMQSSIDSALVLMEGFEAKSPAEEAELELCEFLAWSQQSRLEASREKWTASIFSAKKVLGPLRRATEYKDTYPEFLLPSGLYNFYAETFPDQYPVVKPFMWFFPDGDRQLGLREIEKAFREDPVSQGEAGYFLLRILISEEKDWPKAKEVADELRRRYPANSLFRMLRIQVLYQLKDFAAVRQETDQLIQQFESLPGTPKTLIHSGHSPLTSQIMKDVYFFGGLAWISETSHKNHTLAATYFRKSLLQSQLSGYFEEALVASAWYHLGVCQDNLGAREEALAAYEAARKSKNAGEIKKKAKACIEAPCLYDF